MNVVNDPDPDILKEIFEDFHTTFKYIHETGFFFCDKTVLYYKRLEEMFDHTISKYGHYVYTSKLYI